MTSSPRATKASRSSSVSIPADALAPAARERRGDVHVVRGIDRPRDASQSPERAGDPDAQCSRRYSGTTFSSGAYLSMTIFWPTLGKLIESSPSPPAPTTSTTVPSPHFGCRTRSPR